MNKQKKQQSTKADEILWLRYFCATMSGNLAQDKRVEEYALAADLALKEHRKRFVNK